MSETSTLIDYAGRTIGREELTRGNPAPHFRKAIPSCASVQSGRALKVGPRQSKSELILHLRMVLPRRLSLIPVRRLLSFLQVLLLLDMSLF